MIRTVMTLRMGSNDLQNTTFLINDTQVGYLSQSTRRNQVFSSHRYIQMIAGIRADRLQSNAIEIQRENIRLWQRCSRDVQQRGLAVLPQAASHYNLFPEWLIGLDNRYLHAWLTSNYSVCLMRDGELFQVDPVDDHYSKMPEYWHGTLHQSTVELMEGDYFLFLPPSFFDVISAEETQDVLNGMQQLSVKINELVELCRIRGYNLDASWIALQVQKIEYDTEQRKSLKERLFGLAGVFKKSDPNEAARIKAESSSLRQTSFDRRSARDSSSDYDVQHSDNYQPTEAEMAAAAARASMSYGRNDASVDEIQEDEAARTEMSSANGHFPNHGMSKKAGRGKSQKSKLLSVWHSWHKEQKWLAVLLAISVIILAAWAISTAVNRGDDPESTTSMNESSQVTPTPIPTTEAITQAPVETKLQVNVRSLNFREAPGIDAGLITTLSEGTIVTKIEEVEDGWIKVLLDDGTEAYAYGEYLVEIQETDETSQEQNEQE